MGVALEALYELLEFAGSLTADEVLSLACVNLCLLGIDMQHFD